MICDELNMLRYKNIKKITYKNLQMFQKEIILHIKNCKKCQPERLNEETYSEGFFPPPWSINDHPEKTEGWIAFQEAMRNDPDYYKMR